MFDKLSLLKKFLSFRNEFPQAQKLCILIRIHVDYIKVVTDVIVEVRTRSEWLPKYNRTPNEEIAI